MTLPKDHAKSNPTNQAERENISRAAEKAASAKVRPTAHEHSTHTAFRWNRVYWQEWGERMEAAGLRPWRERGRTPQRMVEDTAMSGRRSRSVNP